MALSIVAGVNGGPSGGEEAGVDGGELIDGSEAAGGGEEGVVEQAASLTVLVTDHPASSDRVNFGR